MIYRTVLQESDNLLTAVSSMTMVLNMLSDMMTYELVSYQIVPDIEQSMGLKGMRKSFKVVVLIGMTVTQGILFDQMVEEKNKEM